MTASDGPDPLLTLSASAASRLPDTWSARRTPHLHLRLPAPDGVALGGLAGGHRARRPGGPNSPGPRRQSGCRVLARRRPPPPPGPAAQPRCAAAAPPRACPGRRNTETLNTEDAQLRARCATQGPAPRPGAPRRPSHLRVRAACLSRPRFSQLRQRGRGLERLANIPQPPPAAWPRSGSRERKCNLGGVGESGLAGSWGDVSEPQRSTRRAQRGVSCLSSGRVPGVS